MTTLPVYVGLDYHQSSIQVCVMDAAGKVLVNRSCENRRQAVMEAVASVGKPVRVAIEACTGSGDLAQELVDHAGWSVDPHRLARRQERWRQMAGVLKAKGKAHGVIVAAIGNRFMRAMYHAWKQMECAPPGDTSPAGLPQAVNKTTGEILSQR